MEEQVELGPPVPVGRFDWERWIKRLRLTPKDKYMALMVATYGNADGTDVRPGVDELVLAACVSKATVKRQLSTLRELGLIELVSRANRFAGLADVYRLTVPANVLDLPQLDPDMKPQNKAQQ